MMNERGIFTLTGLCILLVVVLFVRSAAESETNYSYEVADFQTEYELQNIADSVLIEAAEKIRNNADILPYSNSNVHKERQYSIPVTAPKKSSRLGNITVKVWGERLSFKTAEREYRQDKKFAYKNLKDTGKTGYILISVAECDSERMGGKIYRRSLAYIEDDDENTIHFLKDN